MPTFKGHNTTELTTNSSYWVELHSLGGVRPTNCTSTKIGAHLGDRQAGHPPSLMVLEIGGRRVGY